MKNFDEQLENNIEITYLIDRILRITSLFSFFRMSLEISFLQLLQIDFVIVKSFSYYFT